MIDESTVSTEPPHRWPLVLFLTPVGLIFLSGANGDVKWLSVVAVGAVFVCGGLWSVWFGGYQRGNKFVEKSLVSDLSHFMLTWISGFLLVGSWGLALAKFGELWGANTIHTASEIKSLSSVLFKLSPLAGLIAFGIYFTLSSVKNIWTPVVDGIPIWTKQQALWLLTAIALTVLYGLVAFFVM